MSRGKVADKNFKVNNDTSIKHLDTEQVINEKGNKEVRKTGIDIIGDVRWGTHLCVFYQTKEDLIDVLTPYFKAGLENNEFCMWVTSEHISIEEAKIAMERVMPDFEQYFKKGQIEILPYTEWYLKGGVFNLQRVLNAWIDKLNQALSKGFNGIRVAGNVVWLEKKDWEDFTNYEEEVNKAIGKYRMLAICAYSLDKCGASEVINVISNHQTALIRRQGKWEFIESSGHEKVKEELQKSEIKFRTLVEYIPQKVFIKDKNSVYIFCNKNYADDLKIKPEKIAGKTDYDFYPKELAEKYRSDDKRIIETGKTEDIEEKYIENGEEKWVHTVKTPYKDEKGKTIGVLGIFRDITERKKAEKNLQDIIDKNPMSIQIVDKDGFTLSVNSAHTKLFGSIPPPDYSFFNDPQLKQHGYGELIERIKNGEVVNFPDTPYNAHDSISDLPDVPVWVRVVAFPINDSNGKPERFVFMHEDITERKQATEALKKNEQKVRAVFDQTFQFIGLMTAEGILIEANRAALDFVGIEESAVLNKPFWETPWWTHSAELQKKLHEAIKKVATGEFVRFEATHTAKDGSLHYIDFSLKPVKDETGKVIFMIPEGRDITERKKTEAMLNKVNECFLNFGPNSDENIKKIVEIAGIIFESTCSLYNKEEGELLRTDKGWNLPDDFNQKFTKAGHICCDVIKRGKDEPCVVNNLDKTSYAQTDPNVSKYSLKTYIGCVVKINDKPNGSLCVVYQEDRVFSSDELKVFSILSKALGIEEERKQAEEELKKSASTLKEQKLALEQKNLALKEMIEHIERTKNRMKEDIAINVDETLMPIVEKLKIKGVSPKYIKLLKHHLKNLSSSFGRKITQKSAKLTSREIEICNMIKGSLASKDISELLNVSNQTIEKHRKNIRKKLGLSNKKANLSSYLQHF